MPSINTPDTVDFKDQNVNTDGEYLQNGLPLSTGPELTPGAPPILGNYSIPSIANIQPFFYVDVAPLYEPSHPGSGLLLSVYVPLSAISWNIEVSLDAGSTWVEILAGDESDADTTKLYHINFNADLLDEFVDAFFGGDPAALSLGPNGMEMRAQANFVQGVPGPQWLVITQADGGALFFVDPNALTPPIGP